MAQDVIAHVRRVTDKPIRYVILSHYHAVRVFGASAYQGATIIASDATRGLVVERGEADKASEMGRFPRLFQGAELVPAGLVWPHLTFPAAMTLWLGGREVRLAHIGRGHTAGDIIAHVPDENVVFSGDLVEYHSACYCGDAHLADWPATLDRLAAMKARAIVPGRGAALPSPDRVEEGIASTRAFLEALFGAAKASVARGETLKQCFAATRAAMDARFASYAIYEHCLPFNVSRAYDEARGIDHPSFGRRSATARCGPRCRADPPLMFERRSLFQFGYRRSPDQDAAKPVRHRVVIVGAGPVGLSLAIDLAQRGVALILLDDADRIGEGSARHLLRQAHARDLGQAGRRRPHGREGRHLAARQGVSRRRGALRVRPPARGRA